MVNIGTQILISGQMYSLYESESLRVYLRFYQLPKQAVFSTHTVSYLKEKKKNELDILLPC